MKTALIAIALLSGTAALAQDEVPPPPADTTVPTEAPAAEPMPMTTTADPLPTPPATMAVASTGSTQAPGNAAPEHDARGIAVISDAAAVPAGYNGTMSSTVGTGGPLVDPANTAATGEPAATPDSSYPACSRTVTDNCVQAYERGRRR